jgi:hypothetical protein
MNCKDCTKEKDCVSQFKDVITHWYFGETYICFDSINLKPTTTFENAQVGDKVYDLMYGEGAIRRFHDYTDFKLEVHFDCGAEDLFTIDGRWNKTGNRTLYYAGTKVTIEPAPEPIRKEKEMSYPTKKAEVINETIDKLSKLTGEDFHGYRSEIWRVISEVIEEFKPASEHEKPTLKEWVCECIKHDKDARICIEESKSNPVHCRIDNALTADWKLKEGK